MFRKGIVKSDVADDEIIKIKQTSREKSNDFLLMFKF